ncbi:hypothetical protein [Streptomyces parvulus]|uniref:hypothetical protein n=1 Tax=Streptomyces parvulus TaxID=146923 RepID=UPI0033A523BD
MSTWGEKAAEQAKRAQNRTGEANLTDAVGEGLAAVAYAVLQASADAKPRVWLAARNRSTDMWLRVTDIVSARVRDDAGNGQGGEERFVLEVFVPALSTPDRWLTVAVGASEWFELNAAEQLLLLLEETARSEEDEPAAVFIRIHGEEGKKQELAVDRNY